MNNVWCKNIIAKKIITALTKQQTELHIDTKTSTNKKHISELYHTSMCIKLLSASVID